MPAMAASREAAMRTQSMNNMKQIALTLHNIAEVPISVGINAPLGITGVVKLVVPKGEMRLQLLTRAQRGSLP